MNPTVFARQRASSRLRQLRDVGAADDDAAPRRRVDPGDQVQERRLPGARRSHEREVLPRRNVEVEVLQDEDLDRVPAVDLRDVLDAIRARPFHSPLDSHSFSVPDLGLRRVGDELLAALQTLRGSRPGPGSPARLDGLELRPSADDRKTPGVALPGRERGLRIEHVRLRFALRRRLRGEVHARRHVGKDLVVLVLDRDLHLHGPLRPVGRRNDLQQRAVVRMSG